MESMKLNEIEQQRYAELFSACDIENFGAVSGNTAYELFLTAGLSQETLQQVILYPRDSERIKYFQSLGNYHFEVFRLKISRVL